MNENKIKKKEILSDHCPDKITKKQKVYFNLKEIIRLKYFEKKTNKFIG